MIIFTDIDNTLMQTHRRMDSLDGAVASALDRQGQNLSYMDPAQQQLFKEFLNLHDCVPVTARNRASFDNLLIKFNTHAVLNFGATILNADGSLDRHWGQHITSLLQQKRVKYIFLHVRNAVRRFLDSFELRSPCEGEECYYLQFRVLSSPEDTEEGFAHQAPCLAQETLKKSIETVLEHIGESSNFYYYITDRDLILLPNFIKKDLAVKYLIKNFYSHKSLSIGIGDHCNDLPFMECCDYAMVPTQSTLMALLKNNPEK